MPTPKEILRDIENRMKKTTEVVQREFNTVRTGRASTSMVEDIKVDYYGTPTPLKQLATISIPDPRLIVLQPWDPSSVDDIEKALIKSDLGLTPIKDGKVIRLNVPQLSQERREELVKVIKKMAEDGRISIRSIRRDGNEMVKKLEKDKQVTEDESFRTQEDIQKLTDKYIKEIEEILKKKEKELLEI